MRLNNHQRGIKAKNLILTDKHNFNKEAKFTPVEQGTETFTTTVSLTLPKIERKLFEFEAEKLYPKWIKLRAKRII